MFSLECKKMLHFESHVTKHNFTSTKIHASKSEMCKGIDISFFLVFETLAFPFSFFPMIPNNYHKKSIKIFFWPIFTLGLIIFYIGLNPSGARHSWIKCPLTLPWANTYFKNALFFNLFQNWVFGFECAFLVEFDFKVERPRF